MRKVKIAILLMLIGIAIPSVLAFFQEDGELFRLKIKKIYAPDELPPIPDWAKQPEPEEKRKLPPIPDWANNPPPPNQNIDTTKKNSTATPPIEVVPLDPSPIPVYTSIGIPYRYTIGIGLLLFITGFGLIIFSFIGRKGRGAA